MKKALSLLLFVLITLSMSMPLYAGELTMRNIFGVEGFMGDRNTEVEDTATHFHSIFVNMGSYSPQPGFSITWAIEANDKTWGYTDESEDSELAWKALNGTWEGEQFALTAGYIDILSGNGHNLGFDGVGGFKLDLKPSKMTTVSLFATLTDENGDDYVDGDGMDNTDGAWLSDDDGSEDAWMYGIQLSQAWGAPGPHGAANVASIYYAMKDAPELDYKFSTLGASVKSKIDMVMVSAEIATFMGETYASPMSAAAEDASGLIATVGAAAAISETVNVEANLYYAQGDDDDDDAIMAAFEKRGMQQPLQKGLGKLDHADGTLQLIGKQYNFMSILDGGVIGANLSGDIKVSPATTLSAGIVYGMPEIDGDDAGWDSLVKLNAGVSHSISKSLDFAAGVSYLSFEDCATFEDDLWGALVGLTWMF